MTRRCKGSWLETYLEYTHNQESPTAFHEWVGMIVLSAAVGRHLWIPRIKYTIYPNLFVFLIAGSGECRKSVSSNIGIDLLKSLEKPPMIFAQKITAEALIQALEEAKVEGASSGLIHASELSTFMGSDATKSGIIPALTDLYDSPKEWVYHTRGRGKEVLRNVTLTMLAASTQAWLRSSIPADAVGGGFTSRIIFVCQNTPSRPILFQEENPTEANLRADLIKDLGEIRNKIKGPMEFTDEAKKVARNWYEGEFGKVRDVKLDGYFARKHDTMFKVATLMSVAESSNRIITHVHIKKALDMLAENEKNLGGIIASVVSTTVGGNTERILEIIKREGRIRHSDLLRRCWRFASATDVSEMLKTLYESNEIDVIVSTDNRTRFYSIAKRQG